MSNLVIISGSHRKESNSGRIAGLLKKVCEQNSLFENIDTIDLGEAPLPMWHEDLFADADWKQRWSGISSALIKAEAFVLISPEWSGMVTPAVKNFLLFCTAVEVGDKPCLPVAVSAARGGAFPLSELRMSGYKNNRMSFIAEQLIFRDVNDILSDKEYADKTYMLERSAHSLKILKEYAKAFAQVRNSGVLDYVKYPNGM